jgi:dihydrofolate reductase
MQRMKIVVVSRSLQHPDCPGVTLHAKLNQEWIRALRAEAGKDIWLMGGAELLRALLEMQEVDTIELSVIPILLGNGVSLLPAPAGRTQLRLLEHKAYSSGRLALVYEVQR